MLDKGLCLLMFSSVDISVCVTQLFRWTLLTGELGRSYIRRVYEVSARKTLFCHLYLYKIESLIFAIFVSNDLRNGKAQPYISYTGGFSLMSRWFLAHQLVNLSYVGPITES